jgi:hypothetical protein
VAAADELPDALDDDEDAAAGEDGGPPSEPRFSARRWPY